MQAGIISLVLAAAAHFIVPVHGETVDGKWASNLVVTNPNSQAVTLTVDALYPIAGTPGCTIADPITIPALRSMYLQPSSYCPGSGPRAFTFTSDGPVIATLDVFPAHQPEVGVQSVRVETDWYPGGSRVAITRINFSTPWKRANLLLVNPNPEPMTFTYRRLSGLGNPEHTVFVNAESLAIEPLLASELTCYDSGTIEMQPDPTCGIIVTAPKPFYAGASVIDNATDAGVYRNGTILPATP